MKKTLLATAIAGAMGLSAASAQAATVYNQDGTKLDIYGNVQIAYYNVNNSDGSSRDGIADNGTTFGFAAEHVINPGLVGYLKLEIDDIDAGEMASFDRSEQTGDTAYVGLRGDFGDVRVGSYDQLIDDWIQDPITNNEGFDVSDSTGIHGLGGEQQEDKITYTSPVFGGFQFAVGTQYKGDAEGVNQDTPDPAENLSGDSNASFFGGAKYTVGAFSIAAVYDNIDTLEYVDGNGNIDSRGDQYGVTAQYSIDTLRLAAKAERFDADEGFNGGNDVDFLALGARYGYGMGDIYGAYQNVDPDNEDDRNEVIIGASYNISDAMYTWVEAAWRDQENDAGDGVGVGIVYLF